MYCELPTSLCRVTMPSKLSIEDGYILPHKRDSLHGRSVPVIHPHEWLGIAHWFGHPNDLGELGYFILLVFNSEKLENITPTGDNNPYREFHVLAPVCAIRFAGKYKWTTRSPENYFKYKPIFIEPYLI
jgi:hypothetical protein